MLRSIQGPFVTTLHQPVLIRSFLSLLMKTLTAVRVSLIWHLFWKYFDAIELSYWIYICLLLRNKPCWVNDNVFETHAGKHILYWFLWTIFSVDYAVSAETGLWLLYTFKRKKEPRHILKMKVVGFLNLTLGSHSLYYSSIVNSDTHVFRITFTLLLLYCKQWHPQTA